MPLMSEQGNAHVFIQNTPPIALLTGDIWQDTSQSPPLTKVWNGSTWVVSAGILVSAISLGDTT